jgi:hypothetical protein
MVNAFVDVMFSPYWPYPLANVDGLKFPSLKFEKIAILLGYNNYCHLRFLINMGM